MFGEIADLEFFWSVPLRASPGGIARIASRSGIARMEEIYRPHPCPEIYLYRSFVERLGDPAELTAGDYYRFLADRLILTRSDQWLWFKYNTLPIVPRHTMEL